MPRQKYLFGHLLNARTYWFLAHLQETKSNYRGRSAEGPSRLVCQMCHAREKQCHHGGRSQRLRAGHSKKCH